MKNKAFDCVEMKRRAQERIYEETKNMSVEQKALRHRQLFERLQTKQAELRAKLGLPQVQQTA